MHRRLAIGAITILTVALAALSSLRTVTLAGHRGAARFTEGFRAGRWEARFLVARGPAAVLAPERALDLTLMLSGPGRVQARYDGGESSRVIGATLESWTIALARGGRVAVEGDATLRLHAVRFARADRQPSLAFLRAALAAGWEHSRVVLVALALVGGMLTAALSARGVRAAPSPPSRLPRIAAAIVFVSCLAQVTFLPQPQIIGDPGAYFDMAARFRDALRAPAALGESLHDLRPYGGLAFTATLYGVLRAVRDAPQTIYVAHTLAMAGAVFFLVRASARAGGARLAAIVAALAITYATFPVICGIVQPEPVILLLWCFVFDRLIAAPADGDPRRLVPAGLAFGVGLALHPQGIWYLLAALLLVLAPFAWHLRRAAVRRGALAFGLGLLPVILTTAAGEAYARPALAALEERYGFFAYTAPHPLGFWLFLDTDGWQGPVRLDETRYAQELESARASGEVAGGLDAWAFTVRFVARDAKASLRAVLRNLQRLFRRPDNPFHRAWLMPYRAQVRWHQALVVAFLLATPLLIHGTGAPALVPVAMLAITYPLYHIFNKYAVPATPFLLFGAGVLFARVVESGRRARPLVVVGLAAGLFSLVTPAGLVFAGLDATVARGVLFAAQVGAVLAAFVWVGRQWAPAWDARAIGSVAGAAWLAATIGGSWDDPSWRAFQVATTDAPRQEIAVEAEAFRLVQDAKEAYVAFDLHVADGDPSDLQLEFASGLVVPGSELSPTMPLFGLATVRGGRDPRRFPQWWITPWRPEMSVAGTTSVTVRGSDDSRLGGDVGPDPPGRHHGVSLGHWPLVSVYRLMHEGEYRLPWHQPVDPARRQSGRAGAALDGTYGIRIVALDDDAGGAEWETAPAPAGEIVTAVWARAGRSASAEWTTPSGRISLELGGVGPWSGAGGEVRYVPTGEYEGWYVLRTRAVQAGRVTLHVRPRQEMQWAPRYFLPELRPDPPLPAEWDGLPFVPTVRVLRAREAPAWRPVAVF